MKEICKIPPEIYALLSEQRILNEEKFRFIQFIIVSEVGDSIVLFNSLTRQMVLLDKDEYNNLTKHRETYDFLIKNWILVPEKFNDIKFYEQIYNLYSLIMRQNYINNFIVFPTTDCNARCFYCFERQAQKKIMSNDTAVDVARFMIDKSKGHDITIQLFGGEPLCNIAAIDTIFNFLKANNAVYKSWMISNGYLFDQDLIDKARNNWNLYKVQITLDGTERVYNRIKNYIHGDSNPFERVIRNIKLLLSAGIKVSIRLNLDEHNKNDLSELIDYLNTEFADNKSLLSVYVFLLYDSRKAKKRNESEIEELTNKLTGLEDKIRNYGLNSKKKLRRTFKYYSCLADANSSTTILPDGNLGKCDHCLDSGYWGNIYDSNIKKENITVWKALSARDEICQTCPLYPECIHLERCPDYDGYSCTEERKMRKIQNVREKILFEIENLK